METVAAVNRTVTGRLERNLSLCTAVSAGCGIHLTGSAVVSTGIALLLAALTAGQATARLIGETFLGEEFLLAGSEGELGATVAAS